MINTHGPLPTPTTEDLIGLLSLAGVTARVYHLEHWTDEERAMAANWAARTYVYGADSPEVPSRPSILDMIV